MPVTVSADAGSVLFAVGMRTIGHGIRYCEHFTWRMADPLPDPDADVHIDLSSCTWIDSGFLVRLACVIDQAIESGRSVTMKPCGLWPDDSLAYASRLGLTRLLDDRGIEHDLPAIARRDPQARFVELQEFGGSQLADDLIDIIDTRLNEWGDGYLATVVHNQLYELGLNIEEHARRRGYLMAQWFPVKERLEIAVADYGVGIPASLRTAGLDYGSDEGAIRAAVETRATSKPKDGGFGLGTVRTDAKQYRGELIVTSGDVSVKYCDTPSSTSHDTPWSGTAIDLTYGWIKKMGGQA